MTTTTSEPLPSLEDLSVRVARLEGAYAHLATKADLADLRTELRVEMARMETRLLLRVGGLVLVGLALAAAIGRFVG